MALYGALINHFDDHIFVFFREAFRQMHLDVDFFNHVRLWIEIMLLNDANARAVNATLQAKMPHENAGAGANGG